MGRVVGLVFTGVVAIVLCGLFLVRWKSHPNRSLALRRSAGLWGLLVGAFFMVAAFYIDKANQFPLVYRIVAPRYWRAIAGIEKLHQGDMVLKTGDVGFSEITGILDEAAWYEERGPGGEVLRIVRREELDGEVMPRITAIRTLSFGEALSRGSMGYTRRDMMQLEITYSDHTSWQGPVFDLRQGIDNEYKARPVLDWAVWLLWLGVILTICLGLPSLLEVRT